MKNNENKKSQLLRNFTTACLYGVVFFLLILGADNNTATAETSRINELKQNITSREEEIKKIENEIADYQTRLENIGGQKKTLQNEIQRLDLTRAKLGKDILLTQKKIERATAMINSLDRDIRQKTASVQKNRLLIAEIIHKIDQADSDTLVEILFSHESISDFILEVDEMEKLQVSIRDTIKSLERVKNELNTSKESYQMERKSLVTLNEQLSDQKQIADDKRVEQATLLSTTKNEESNYKKMLANRLARKKQFEREIEDFEAQLRVEIDPSTFPAPGTKVLAYPLENILVTQTFGRTVDSKRLYVSGTHNGTDFRASPGTPVKSAGDGIVVGTGDTDVACRWASYGRWVLIRHNNGLTSLYAHLDLIKAYVGEKVQVGDLIGYSGNTGYSTGPHLHMGLFVSSAVSVRNVPSKSCPGAVLHLPVAPQNAYLDPESYL